MAAAYLAVGEKRDRAGDPTVCTHDGRRADPDDETTLLTNLKVSEVPKLMRDGVIKGGMIPKVDCCVEAVRKGVEAANIQDGRVKHSILIELLSKVGVGTMFQ